MRNLHRVIDLLPSLAWQGNQVGVRIAFSPADPNATLERFQNMHAAAQATVQQAADAGDGNADFVPSPHNLTEFLTDELRHEYEFRYYVLDRAQFDGDFREPADYEPLEILADKGRTGRHIINSLMRVDFLQAQRHLSDASGGSRAEELSRHLSRFYSRNLEKRGDDYEAIRALSESETLLNQHLEQVFAPTLERLADLGYPGFTNPRLVIKSTLNPETVMNSQDGAQVHYELDEFGLTLPDKYSGLGFKNLIYMVVELLDFHAKWFDIEDKRPPLHLIFIEEPEAHLHAQLQQVFVNKILDILTIDGADQNHYCSQLVLTTHSPHILYERGFRPIRYFRREHSGAQQSTTVLNLSNFYATTANPTRDFLKRYLKLTHCDLFFADAVILVEGNVERLLMPQMIETAAPELKSVYLSILEIGGAFGHRFQTLIEFLGITALIVTDLDSVTGAPLAADGAGEEVADAGDPDDAADIDENEDIDEEDEGPQPKLGSTCRVETPHAVTSNQTLIQWLPGMETIADLLAATAEHKLQMPDNDGLATVRVCYQTSVIISRGAENMVLAGRTFEEAFAFENLNWCQDITHKDLKLRVKSSDAPKLAVTAERLHNRIHGKNFKKTDFALALLSKDPANWAVPTYIREGLEWLQGEFRPPIVPAPAEDQDPT